MNGARAQIPSPVGLLTLVADEYDRLVELRIASTPMRGAPRRSGANGTRVLSQAASELEEYFDGRRRSFEVPIAQAGTRFELAVWHELLDVGYGETVSYGRLARMVGRPGAARAVGMALRRNPIPIIVPCHRIISANGSLTGYAAGLDAKRFLLELEARGRLPGLEHSRQVDS
jgi:methylated-DNA-[protein]-cysteine S-methyltransferase